ncbi:Membrane bound lytic murein transglycosylase B [Pseudooceanicola batsensis HTCC2597]|uniref:Membrane bound lytic murein transglycosylase B n=1 Tax=Pseudooceanicola batsensis (strain ATCC BAA-863 / DSM 15984 / KCTC 12145 / HTCC2597) TaxID=252305 RepID=A3U262_PSEBH|nr:Membrane bound lytic murein transglycosylase B [Pseudooceanicola batsensis HTCC2597]
MRTVLAVTCVSLVALSSGPARTAEPVPTSLRPVSRPAPAAPAPAPSEARVIAALAVKALAPQPATAPMRTLRPRIRPAVLVTAAPDSAETIQEANPAGFTAWIGAFRSRALAQGIDAATFDRTFARVRYLPDVIRLDRKQSEFTKTTGEYLASAVSDTRVETGREKAQAQGATLRAIEARYGVDRNVVAAVWGMETNYGGYRGRTHIPSALATLAYDGRRGAFFEKQLIAALRILQNGDTTPENMVGSWAGAMGHTQFMPTSYAAYAVDFTGDGRRDIWAGDPTDALASTAAYLSRMGWQRGMPWGAEVTLPAGFDFTHASGPKKLPSDWARLGVRPAAGGTLADHGPARLLLPAGARGVAFLVFKNFDVIKRYNNSDAYALGVGHLGDRIGGAGPLRGGWPDGERALKRAERQELQSLLTRAGYSTGGIDGKIGPNTVRAIRGYQQRVGMAPDGHPSVALLTRLRR